MNLNIEMERVLRSMGYRPMKGGIWGKPIAYQILTAQIHEGEWELSNRFKGPNGKYHVWSRKTFTDVDTLKNAEVEVIHIVLNGYYGDFEFETAEDLFSALL